MDAELTSIKESLYSALRAHQLNGFAMHVSKATTTNELYLLARIGLSALLSDKWNTSFATRKNAIDAIEAAETALIERSDYTLG